jgi:hypothetical protein
MSNKPFIVHQFFCAKFAGSPRGGLRGANKNRWGRCEENDHHTTLPILRIDVTILQQINGNPQPPLRGAGRGGRRNSALSMDQAADGRCRIV